MLRALSALMVAGVLVAAPAPIAWADGDPASDILASQALFLPQDADLPAQQRTQLESVLRIAHARGYDLHVAVIASASDLGSVGALWGSPQRYARFLGQEIALVVRGPLLIVMPDGYGFETLPASAPRSGLLPDVLAALPPPGRALGSGATAAIRRLAAASGHPLPLVSGASASGGPARSDAAAAWGVFGLGWAAIFVAWGLSLRARPPGAGPPERGAAADHFG